MIEAVFLALALAMDATAVAATRGMSPGRRVDALILPLLFGVFQAGMAALGWLTGDWGGDWFADYDHWIAAVLLVGMGGKMIVDARLGKEAKPEERTGAVLYFALAFATSIDAAAAGIALPLLAVNPWLAVTLIGVITAVASLVGFLVGRAIGDRFGRKLHAIAGAMLIAIAIRVLIEHLS